MTHGTRPALVLAVLLTLPGVVNADRLTAREGTVVEGEIQLEVLTLPAQEGEIEIPASSIRELRIEGRELEVSLVDGTTMSTEVPSGEIGIATGLIVRKFAFQDLGEIVFEHDPRELLAGELEGDGFARVDQLPEVNERISTPCPLRIELPLPKLDRSVTADRSGIFRYGPRKRPSERLGIRRELEGSPCHLRQIVEDAFPLLV